MASKMMETTKKKNSEDAYPSDCWVDSVCGASEICGVGQVKSELEDNQPTKESDLTIPDRRIWVVTTATLPWMTGTAMNPLMRALFLTQNRPKGYVTLVIPWLTKRVYREKLYGEKFAFSDGELGRKEQEEYIRNYARERCDAETEVENLKILFYLSSYNSGFGSIFPTVDVCSLISNNEADVAILEEPEHLNWFRVPSDISPERDYLESKDEENKKDELIKQQLGWAYKFRHVVGIIHTNYAAYARQNGIGTAVLGAPTINIASALVVRAYCHKVIKLSPVIPVYAPGKETTENVHGVRNEFLKPKLTQMLESDNTSLAQVYFIGKMLWAKGFDNMLEIQEKFKYYTGAYFPIDVYGSGPDEKQIIRAFHGRIDQYIEKTSPIATTAPKTTKKDDPDYEEVFGNPLSIRSRSSDSLKDHLLSLQDIENKNSFSSGEDDRKDPLSILYDISGKSVNTGIKASKAVCHLADSAIQTGLAMAFTKEPVIDEKDGKKTTIVFDPPKSRFELRLHPIPAKFLGRKDHAALHNLPYKIFFNPSVSEVLCTTTAEALAMGFFVIIPKHPSNEFFYQFTNCLTYETIDECVEHLKWALSNENHPTPLSQDESNVFTWKAATERLIRASAITKTEAMLRKSSGLTKNDERIAWFHSESGKTGNFVRNFFAKKGKKRANQNSENAFSDKIQPK